MNALNYSIPKEIPRTKFFEGKKYGIRGITPKKSIADKEAEERRALGYLSRVVGLNTQKSGQVWCLYSRQRDRKQIPKTRNIEGKKYHLHAVYGDYEEALTHKELQGGRIIQYSGSKYSGKTQGLMPCLRPSTYYCLYSRVRV